MAISISTTKKNGRKCTCFKTIHYFYYFCLLLETKYLNKLELTELYGAENNFIPKLCSNPKIQFTEK